MIQRRPPSESPEVPYSSPTIASAGRTSASRVRTARSTARSASLTGVRSGLVSTTRSSARNRASVISSATSASSRASVRSSSGAATGLMLRAAGRIGWGSMTPEELQSECTDVLQRLVRFNTVNPPGDERAAIEYLEQYVSQAGFETQVLGATDERPNLVADPRGEQDGPTLCFLAHVDTVLADASEWTHDPWSGDVEDGFLWGRGSLDMKSQVAAEAVAGVTLARSGWRPARGTLKLVFVADEETGGEVGAHWLCENHPDKVRCDMLLNEGGG